MATKSILVKIANHLKSKYKKSLSRSQCFTKAHEDMKNITYTKELVCGNDLIMIVAYNRADNDGKVYQRAYIFINGKLDEATGSFPFGSAIEIKEKIELKRFNRVIFTYRDRYQEFANLIESIRNKHFMNRAFSNMSAEDRKYWNYGS